MIAVIVDVEIIGGSYAGQGWRMPMQKITTNKGVYIDNNVGVKGNYWRAPDYSSMKRQQVDFTPVDDHNNMAAAGPRGYYQWMRLKQFD